MVVWAWSHHQDTSPDASIAAVRQHKDTTLPSQGHYIQQSMQVPPGTDLHHLKYKEIVFRKPGGSARGQGPVHSRQMDAAGSLWCPAVVLWLPFVHGSRRLVRNCGVGHTPELCCSEKQRPAGMGLGLF